MLILITVKRKTFDGENEFFQDRVSTATGSAFIFLSLALMSQLRTTTEIHGDGTFKNTPSLFYQLFTVHIVYKGKVIQTSLFF